MIVAVPLMAVTRLADVAVLSATPVAQAATEADEFTVSSLRPGTTIDEVAPAEPAG